jgi:hypothetical protein
MFGFAGNRETGVAGLLEQSRAAHRHANQTPEDIEQMAIELRQAHMRWVRRSLNACSKRTFAIKIRMAPANSRSYAMAVLSPRKPPRQALSKAVMDTAPVQLNLFPELSPGKNN